MAVDVSPYVEFFTAAITTNTAVTLPANTKSVSFQPRDVQMTISHASGGAYQTIPMLGEKSFDNRNLNGKTFYFTGTGNLDYCVEYGLGC